MPIRVQNDLPVKEILEQENIFVMDEFTSGYPTYQYRVVKPDAFKRRYRVADSAGVIKYTAAGGCDICEGDKPCIQEYIHQSYL